MNQFTPEKPLTKTTEILLNAMALLEDPDRWAKRSYARTATGDTTDTSSPEACKFCMLGAVEVFTGTGVAPYRHARQMLMGVLLDHTKYITVPGFNDHGFTNHEKVMQVMTAAAFEALAAEDEDHD